jgi:hypothetical protein
MVMALLPENISHSPHIIVQRPKKTGQEISAHSVLLRILKPLETQLRARRLIAPPAGSSVQPLWFHAVTERNLFLWRSGYSLGEQDSFEFWVNPEKLVNKRLLQLDLIQKGEVQLLTLAADMPKIDEVTASEEKKYLEDLLVCLRRIHQHAFGLSQIALMVQRELDPRHSNLPVIALPN